VAVPLTKALFTTQRRRNTLPFNENAIPLSLK
jgi:hypothetical protein